MKLAISATGPDLDAQIDPRFGRCPYFIVIDPQTMEYEAIETLSSMAAGGAGIATAQMIASKGVQVVLTGNCGPNAYHTLAAAGIQVISGVAGGVREAVEGYKLGRLRPASQPSVGAHFGMGMGRGMGGGRGMGRGMGGGAGMGPASTAQAAPAPRPTSPQEDLEALRGQARALKEQLAQVEQRINKLRGRHD